MNKYGVDTDAPAGAKVAGGQSGAHGAPSTRCPLCGKTAANIGWGDQPLYTCPTHGTGPWETRR